jgi:hypothetical protein
MKKHLAVLVLIAVSIAIPGRAMAQLAPLPQHLRDRGPGLPTSLFATYVERGQWVLFPYAAYTHDGNMEYQPSALGYGSLNEDFRGEYWSTQAQFFLAYGVTDWLALEVETSRIHARFDKSPSDTTAVPARIDETGLADFEAQVRVRVAREHGARPELFASLEIIPAQQQGKTLIIETPTDVRAGIGVIRGYRWGTLTFRTTVEFNHDDQSWELGETSLEYLKQLSSAARLLVAIEGGEGGAPDDYGLVTGLRWRLGPGVFLKFDNAIGLQSKATDLESQLGLLFELH